MSKASSPEPAALLPLADRFAALFADAAAEGIALPDERDLHARFLDAALAGDHARCKQMLEDAESHLGAVRAAQRIEAQRQAAAREIHDLRTELGPMLRDARLALTHGRVAEIWDEFEQAARAGNLEAAREVVARYRRRVEALARPPEVVAAERRTSGEAANKAFEEAQRERAKAAHIEAIRDRCARGWDLLGEIEKSGTVRLGVDGAVLYSGLPLDDDLMLAIEFRAEHVRTALRQRWQDRVLVEAPEPAGPATAAAAA